MKKKKVIISGAGLCGTLLAIRLAQRGHDVHLYEKRQDLRKADISAGRSINLALSDRGLRALAMVGLEQDVRKVILPMKARLIHFQDGQSRISPYSGRPHEHINSVSRPGLNAILLEKAESYPNIKIRFETPCIGASLEERSCSFLDKSSGQSFHENADIIIGTDGAGSAIRSFYFRESPRYLFNFSQHFLRHGYKELSILPGSGGSHKLASDVLHIWPRGSFMMIALPNLDGSFTVTCFFPFTGDNGFDSLDNWDKVYAFFQREFPDALHHMPHLQEEFFENPTSSLGTIKCLPWVVHDSTLLMGDAAHAIVPFYGQGMNCAFEDVLVLDEKLDQYAEDWPAALGAYEQERKKDTDAIADLAIDNFYEMRDHVANPAFIKKRKLEMKLESNYKDYASKYSLVTFHELLPYSYAMALGRAQDQILLDICQNVDSIEEIDLEDTYRILTKMREDRFPRDLPENTFYD